MQKQSFELIELAKTQTEVETIIYRSKYPKLLFLLTVTFRVFLRVLRNPDLKLVHANDGLMAMLLTPLLSMKRIKICATVHGLDVVFNLSFYQWWVRNYLPKFSFLIAVSEATKQECEKVGVPSENIYFIPNAVELPELVTKDDSFADWLESTYNVNLHDKLIISSVGRPVPRKGFGWFADRVLPKIPNTIYLVVGTEMESRGIILALQKILPKTIFEKLCKMLGVPLDTLKLSEIAKKDKQLVLLGKVSHKKLFQTYLHTDIFAMPNLRVKGDFEGFGLVALEAGVFGAICLAANVDGIPSAIQDGKNGYLLESANEDAWISKIEELRKDDGLRKARAGFQRHFADRQISWKEVGTQYLKLFEEKINQ